jgi:hypothetical protein
MAQLNFDARQIPPQTALEPVPSGWQHMAIKDSELKPTKDNTGVMLVLTLVVLDGPFAGRQMFDRLNLQNPSPQAAEIGQRRLSAYCHATGVMQVADSGQLHGIPMNVKLGVRTDATGQYEPTNEVKAVKHITEPTDGSAHAQTSAPQAPAGATPPWSQQAKFVQASAPAAAPAPAQTPPWAQPAQAQPQPQPMLQQPAQSPPWAQPAQTVQTAQAQNTQQPTQPAGSFPPAAAPPMGATPPWAQPPVAQPMQPVQAAPAQTPPWAQPQQPPVAQQFVQQQPQQFTQTPPWAQPQR